MENSSDKQLRDKLNSTEFPFDPQAWEKMEGMLDGKKTRRGFFWWWTGGIAAALLFGLMGYELRGLVGSKQLAVGKEQTEISAQTSEESAKRKAQNANGKEQNESVTETANQGEIVQVLSSTGETNSGENTTVTFNNNQKQNKAKVKKHIAKSHKETTTENPIASVSKGTNTNTGSHKSEMRNRTAATTKNKRAKNAGTGNAVGSVSGKQLASGQQPATNNKQQTEVAMLNVASGKSALEEYLSLTRREASLLEYISEKENPSFDKKTEDDVLPKTKKKIFNYSLGVLANVTGTTLGKQPVNGEHAHSTMFYNKPSFMVGFTHDFLFVNRVAITNSILYSQTSFDVMQPQTVSFTQSPTYYSSKIQELTIPIGIKVYPVVKNNFRFYINTGIINHIKLKETFRYALPVDTVYNAAVTPNNLADQFFPVQTNFGNVKAVEDMNSGIMVTESSTKDFSVNSAKRYYASFYASAGFEYIAKKHFILFTEPMFYMSLQKIGVQEKRKYNFGLSGGFRYQF